MFSHVIFDLDGTLLNTLDDLADAANWVCEARGWPTHPTDAYRLMAGNGIPKLCERFSPPAMRSPQELRRTRDLFEVRYAEHSADKTAPYPGIEALLVHLEELGVQFGVVTNKDDAIARTVLHRYFGDLVRFVQGRLDTLPPKPAPETTLRLMAAMGASPAATLFVGDSNVDIATAQNAALASCGVLWGFRTREELLSAGAQYLAETPRDLERLILL